MEAGNAKKRAQEEDTEESPDKKAKTEPAPTMKVHFIEIVTPNAEATIKTYSSVHGVTFGDPVAELGGARTTKLEDGGLLSVRAPMHDQEKAVVRPYMLVKDIEAAVAGAEKAGALIAVPPMKIEGHGTIAIFIQDDIESGLWQL